MKQKVLLADDSQTIQKVIQIIVSKEAFELTIAPSEEALFQNLNKDKYNLVCLDFNLSEQKTGYDLAQLIKQVSKNSSILLLLGTFDQIEDELLKKNFIDDTIVKPFDGNKFLSVVKRLLEQNSDDVSDDLLPPVIKKSVDQTKPFDRAPSIEKRLMKDDWTIEVPSIIGADETTESSIPIPPVIGSESEAELETFEETKLPSVSDLDFPEVIPPEIDESSAPLDYIPEQLVDSPSTKTLPKLYQVDEESDINKLQSQVMDEVSEDLWKVNDQFVKEDDTLNNFDFKPNKDAFGESLFESPEPDESRVEDNQQVDFNSHELKNLIESEVKNYFEKTIQEVAWDVIPKLAEKIIKEEVEKIKNEVLNK